MKIIFIRHGKFNLQTGKLSLRGLLQVKNAREYVKNEKIDAIFCSPQTRSIQTAHVLNKVVKSNIHIVKEFDSRRFLKLEDLDCEKEYKDNYLNYNYSSNRFETCKDYIDRIFSGLNHAFALEKEAKTIILVGHSSMLYALNAYLNGLPENKQISWIHCNNGAVIKFEKEIKIDDAKQVKQKTENLIESSTKIQITPSLTKPKTIVKEKILVKKVATKTKK